MLCRMSRGVTGMKIIGAIVAGERGRAAVAALRDTRWHASIKKIQQALTGNDREAHTFALAQALQLYDLYQDKVEACDVRIEAGLKRLHTAAAKPAGELPPPRHTAKHSNAPAFNAAHGALRRARRGPDADPRPRA